jgi:hypothetical protein
MRRAGGVATLVRHSPKVKVVGKNVAKVTGICEVLLD